jgi:hypothetical protein
MTALPMITTLHKVHVGVFVFKLRTIVIFLTALVFALVIGTQVYGQSTRPVAVDKEVPADTTTEVSADTLAYDKLASGPEGWKLIFNDAVAEAKNIIETPKIDTPTDSAVTEKEYYNNAGAWGG